MSVSAWLDPLGADDGEAVAGQEQLGLERRHPAQRRRPLGGVALDLLGVAGVRARPDEQVAAAQGLGPRDPRHGVVVGLALLVAQVERGARRRRGVRSVA